MNAQQMADAEEALTKAVSVPSFVEHEKKIHTTKDLNNWVRSRAYYDVVAYISNTSVAIQGQRMRGKYPVSEQMQKLCNIFNRLEHLVNENLPPGWQLKNLRAQMPPVQSSRQSCIRSYRAWMRHMYHNAFVLLDKALNPKCKFLHELGYYFSQAFGSTTCLDYGPGNELMFIFFLCALFKSGILEAQDTVAAALMLYERYIQLVRRLIVTYMLPTSGTRKHYNLVDYYALEYVWGTAQLCIDGPFDPLSSDNCDIVKEFHDDYMLIAGIDFLQKHRGRLRENAYQLWCILSVSNWTDVYYGLSSSYIKEILGSFATVSSCVFSELMTFDFVPTGTKITHVVLGQPTKSGKTRAPGQDDQEEGLAQEDQASSVDASALEDQVVNKLKPPVELYIAPKAEQLFVHENQTSNAIDYSNDFHDHPFCMPRGDLRKGMHSTIDVPSSYQGQVGRTTTTNSILDTSTSVIGVVATGFASSMTIGLGATADRATITTTSNIIKDVPSSALQFGARLSIGSAASSSTEEIEPAEIEQESLNDSL